MQISYSITTAAQIAGTKSDRRTVALDKVLSEERQISRDWKCFHPSQYETWDGATFGDMPDLCHRTPFVYTELIN